MHQLFQNKRMFSTSCIILHNSKHLNHEVSCILLNYATQVLGAIPNPRQSADVYHEIRRGSMSTAEATIIHHIATELHINAFTQIATKEPHFDDWEDCFLYLFPPKDMIRRPHTSLRAKYRQPAGAGHLNLRVMVAIRFALSTLNGSS